MKEHMAYLYIDTKKALSALCAIFAVGISTCVAATDIEQKPLLVADPLPPNIMFVLDDSGSMFRDDMPDEIGCSSAYSDNSRVIHYSYTGGYSTGNLLTDNERCESPDYNEIYYDPSVTYEAPVDENGDSLGDSNFYNAWINGFERNYTKNLSQWVQEETWEYQVYYDWGRERRGWYCDTIPVDNVCPNGSRRYDDDRDRDWRYWEYEDWVSVTEWRPFRYFVYDETNSSCSGPWDDDCYDAVYVDLNESDELQNVANWYSYYRTRLLIAKSGASLAFNDISPSYRLGWGSINKPGTINQNVRKYQNGRNDFYEWIDDIWSGYNYGTPLRRALGDIGEYYKTSHPYLIDPDTSDSGELSCRQNFTILMTDGYWNGDSASHSEARDENDNEDGPVITGAGGVSYQYTPVHPFRYDQSNNLADIAMYYWKNDLRPGDNNNQRNDVPASQRNPAFWQHMVTIGIGLGVIGAIEKDEAFDAIDTATEIDWSKGSSDEEKIDDLLHASVNSRGNFFSAKNPAQFTSGLKELLADIASRIGAGTSLSASAAELVAGTTLYNATYRSGDWSGALIAFNIDETSGEATSIKWSANFPLPANRKVFTHRVQGSNLDAVRLTSASNMDSDMQSALTAAVSVSNNAEHITSYLLGDRSREQNKPGGVFRNRPNGILGDIVHSSPIFVGKPDESLYKFSGWAERTSHVTFANSNSNRTPVIYVGANDGMLHAFSDATGSELFAFMPRAVVMNGIGSIADPDYDHRYFLDGALAVQDVYMHPNWKTVLVGTTGRAGSNSNDQVGKAIYALDVTSPDTFNEDNVMWEISHNAIGQITTKPVLAKLEDGHWYAILGNGYNSALGKPALIKIRLSTGAITVMEVNGSAGGGLAGPLVWDSDQDGTFDTAYAGDLEGRVWSFDLNGNNTPTVVYQAKDASGKAQPITATVTGSTDSNNKTWIFFGTGRYFNQTDMSNRDVQSWYGIRPEDTDSSTTRSNLKERTITSQGDISGYTGRIVSESVAGDMAGKLGWFMDLKVVGGTSEGERIVNPSLIRGDVLLGSTLIPIADACNPGGDGFVMAVDPFTGARLNRIYFDFNNDGLFDSQDKLNGASPSGLSVGRIPSAGIFISDNLFFNTDSGLQENIATNPGAGAGETERMSWREVVDE